MLDTVNSRKYLSVNTKKDCVTMVPTEGGKATTVLMQDMSDVFSEAINSL